MADPYQPVITALRGHSITAHFQTAGQLVVSCQIGPVWPDRGNSFWITNVHGQWYLATWSPVYYRVPSSSDIVALCVECMGQGEEAMFRVPDQLVNKHSLEEIPDTEFDQLAPPTDEFDDDGAV